MKNSKQFMLKPALSPCSIHTIRFLNLKINIFKSFQYTRKTTCKDTKPSRTDNTDKIHKNIWLFMKMSLLTIHRKNILKIFWKILNDTFWFFVFENCSISAFTRYTWALKCNYYYVYIYYRNFPVFYAGYLYE